MVRYYIDGFSQDHQKAMRKLNQSVQGSLMKAGMYLEEKLKDQTHKDRHDTGALEASIHTRQVGKGKVEIGTNLGYGLVMEHGRKPGKFPNLNALVGRTARKGMHHGGVTTKYKDLHYADKGIVFMIARSIARKGIKGKETFKKTLAKEKENVLEVFRDNLHE